MQIENNNPKFYNPPIDNFDLEYDFEGTNAVPYDVSLLPIEHAEYKNDFLFNASNDCTVIN